MSLVQGQGRATGRGRASCGEHGGQRPRPWEASLWGGGARKATNRSPDLLRDAGVRGRQGQRSGSAFFLEHLLRAMHTYCVPDTAGCGKALDRPCSRLHRTLSGGAWELTAKHPTHSPGLAAHEAESGAS